MTASVTNTTWTQKSTFTIKNNFAEKLGNYKNKSKVVNIALNLYFEREKFLKKAEEEFLETFEIEEFRKEEIDSLKKKWKKDYDKICSLID